MNYIDELRIKGINYLLRDNSVSSLIQEALVGLLLESVADTKYQPKGAYLTQHQDISGLATKAALQAVQEAIPSIVGLASETYVNNKISEIVGAAPEALDTLKEIADKLGNNDDVVTALTATVASKANSNDVYTKSQIDAFGFLTAHQSLADYALISSVPTKVSDLTNDLGFLTEHQSLANYALKSEVPSIVGLISETAADEKYQPKGAYLTEHQSLADYLLTATFETFKNQIWSNGAFNTVITKNNGSTATIWNESDGGGIQVKSTVSNIKSFIGLHNGGDDEAGFYANFYTIDDTSKQGTRIVMTPSGVFYTIGKPSLAERMAAGRELAVKADLTALAATIPSLSGYATEEWVGQQGFATQTWVGQLNFLTLHQSLTDYALKSELFSGSYTDLTNTPTNVSAFTNDAGYLTEHQSLADYALRSELGTLGNLVIQPIYAFESYDSEGTIKHGDGKAQLTGETNDGYSEIVILENNAIDSEAANFVGLKFWINSDAEPDTLYDLKDASLNNVGLKVKVTLDTAGVNRARTVSEFVVASLNGYATQSWVNGVLNDLLGIDAAAVSGLVSILSDSDTTTGILNLIASKADASVLSNYALKTELFSGSYADLTNAPTNVSAFTNDAGYLTEHQSLTGYATETWVGQQGFLTQHQDISGKADVSLIGNLGNASEAVAAQEAVYYTQEEADAYNTENSLQEGDEGFVTTETIKTPAVEAVAAVPHTVKSYIDSRLAGLKLVVISQSDYDNLLNKDSNTLYIIQ